MNVTLMYYSSIYNILRRMLTVGGNLCCKLAGDNKTMNENCLQKQVPGTVNLILVGGNC